MPTMPLEALLREGRDALAAGRWAEARAAFERAVPEDVDGEARFGLATALWWSGEDRAGVAWCRQAYGRALHAGEVGRAVQCAVWLAITYKADFADHAVANGWLARADRLLAEAEPGPLLRAWVDVARAYRHPDLEVAEALTTRALALARGVDVDLELVALAQLGLVRVSRGQVEPGFALLDEAMAGAMAGEAATLDTVAYVACDLLTACERASDLRRAVQWCRVADEFTATYGCPFLHAECRIAHAGVLADRGRWVDAADELHRALRATEAACPALHARAAVRLARLRVVQGRPEEAAELLERLAPPPSSDATDDAAERDLATAELDLARGAVATARRRLEARAAASSNAGVLALLAEVARRSGDTELAGRTAARLRAMAAAAPHDERLAAVAVGAGPASGSEDGDVARLDDVVVRWDALDQPYLAARARAQLADALASADPGAAVALARHALGTFEALGARPDADRAAALLRALGVRVGTGRRDGAALTARERDVLHLLGLGLTNPEIAARLHVSRKTAAHHVSHVLTKLGVRNRAEAAAFAARHGG